MEPEINVFLDEDALQTSLESGASIQPDSRIFPFRSTQFRSDSLGTPHKFPSAPHPSPVLSPDQNVVSRLKDLFESQLLKACNTICDQTKLIEATVNDRATASPYTSPEKLLQVTPKESERMPTFYVTTNPLEIANIIEPVLSSSSKKKEALEFGIKDAICEDSNDVSECMVALLPSNSSKKELLKSASSGSECIPKFYVTPNRLDFADILDTVSASSSPLKRPLETTSVESDTETYSKKFLLECGSPMRLASSMSNIRLQNCPSSPFREKATVFVHCESEIPDHLASKSEILLSPEYTLNPVNQTGCDECCGNELCEEYSDKGSDKEKYDKMNMDFPMNSWQVYSPRRPPSSVGKFLNWRKNRAMRRKTGTSVDNVHTPQIRRIRDEDDSKFLMTV